MKLCTFRLENNRVENRLFKVLTTLLKIQTGGERYSVIPNGRKKSKSSRNNSVFGTSTGAKMSNKTKDGVFWTGEDNDIEIESM